MNKHLPLISNKTVAAIDLGTNSCRLLIARIEGTSFRILDSFSRVVRLGENVQSTHRLTDEAINRTLSALRICKGKIEQYPVSLIRAVTTEACRRAQNSHILIDRALNEIGIPLEIISPVEEARLGLAGCASILNTKIPYGITFDIGGGSTEIMWLHIQESRGLHRRRFVKIHVIDCISLPYGVVTLSEQYQGRNQTKEAYDLIRQDMRQSLQAFSEKNNIQNSIQAHQCQMIGTSGTITTLAAIHKGLPKYDRKMVDGTLLNTSDIHRTCDLIVNLTPQERMAHSCIGPHRSDYVLVGASVLEAICDVWPVPQVKVADRGVREGILTDMVRKMWPPNSGSHSHFIKIKF